MHRVRNLSPEDLNLIVGTIDDGITLQAPDGHLLYANDAAARIIGLPSAAALLGQAGDQVMQAFEILDEAGNPTSDIPPRRALAGQSAEQVVRFRVRKTGEERWSIVKSTPSFAADGTLKFAINIFRDITERKRADDALRVSHEWLATTLRSIGDAVIATDRNGRITFLNAAAEEITGWASADASGRLLDEVFRIINEQTRQIVESPVAKVLRHGVVVGLANHTLLVRKDGSEVAIDDSAAPIRNVAGALAGVVLVFRNIDARRREEERLQFIHDAIGKLGSSLDYEATLRAVANLAVPHVADWCTIDVLDDDGRPRRLAVAHVDPEKVALAHELERRHPTPPDSPRGLPQVLRTGKTEWAAEIPDAFLVEAIADEEPRQIARDLGLRAYIIAPMIARGRTLGAISFVAAERIRSFDARDVQLAEAIAERAAVALDNARLFRDAENATNLREQLLSIVSHDLRNPLGAIMMGAATLKKRLAEEPELVKTAERIAASADRMNRMIHQLLDFSSASLGRGLPIAPQPMLLNDLCQGVVDELQTAHSDAELRIEPAPSIRGAWDPDRLGEVMSNLVANAIRYGDGGPISVKLRADGDEAAIVVHNHGEPIPEGVLPHLFDPFRRGREDDKAGGVGLGLYIARSIVAAHGGRIDTESSREHGTTFTVRLPLRRA